MKTKNKTLNKAMASVVICCSLLTNSSLVLANNDVTPELSTSNITEIQEVTNNEYEFLQSSKNICEINIEIYNEFNNIINIEDSEIVNNLSDYVYTIENNTIKILLPLNDYIYVLGKYNIDYTPNYQILSDDVDIPLTDLIKITKLVDEEDFNFRMNRWTYYSTQEKELPNLTFKSENKYFYNISISHKNNALNLNCNANEKRLIEQLKFEDIIVKDFYTIENLYQAKKTGNIIDKENIIDIRNNINEKNYILNMGVKNFSPIYSLDDNGYITYYKNNKVVIQYNNFALYVDGIIIEDEKISTIYNQNDIIGYSKDRVEIFILSNNEFLNLNHYISDFSYANKSLRMPQYLQYDEKWGKNIYGSTTIGDGGCGPASFAMVLSYLRGYEFTPDVLVDEMCQSSNGDYNWYYCDGKGSYFSMFERLAQMYNVQIDNFIQYDEKSLKSKLQENKSIIICIQDGPYYENGHFIVLRGTENGKFYINDSYGKFEQDKLYDYSSFGTITCAFAFY